MIAFLRKEAQLVIDINGFEDGSTLDADICLIGSGAAGITIAREFLNTQTSVIVLEAGGKTFEMLSQDPYQSHIVGLAHRGIHVGRVRQMGGSTTLWAGQALPFFPIDFEKRSWVPHSGWPITRESLMPFYRRAHDVMQIPQVSNDAASWPAGKPKPPAYSPDLLVSYFSQFAIVPNFVQKYGEAIAASPNIRILTHGNVTALEANPTATALEKVIARTLEGHEIQVKARYFVVCCGGIESARLLLLSDSVESQGIGNRHDVVGRYFQDHAGVAVPVEPIKGSAFHDLYDSFRIGGMRYAIKVVASDTLQRNEQTTHIGGEIYYPAEADDPIAAAKDLLKIATQPKRLPKLPAALGKVLSDPGRVAAAAYRFYVKKMPASVGSSQPLLGLGGEQEPNPESRITLAAEKDALGLRRTSLKWSLTRNDVRSMEVYIRAVATEWKRLAIATLREDLVDLTDRENGVGGIFVDTNHHMGSTRMGEDPRTSVVDKNCRVHNYDNLYIGSSSVFPTGSFSNPTLTMIALCLRLADELKLKVQ